MAGNFIPHRGDVVWIDMQPQAGHEQSGRRPAIVLSPKTYNGKVGLALLCPITNLIKGYPFEVVIPSGLKITGVVLSDQVKALIGKLGVPNSVIKYQRMWFWKYLKNLRHC